MNTRQRKKHDPWRWRHRACPKPPLGPYMPGVRHYWTRMLKNGVRHRQKRVTILPDWTEFTLSWAQRYGFITYRD